MRTAGPLLVLGTLALAGIGCIQDDPPDWGPEPTADDGAWTSTDDGNVEPECRVDGDCAATQVCAHDWTCYAASAVRPVHVSWTIQGQHPTAAVCGPNESLQVGFAEGDVAGSIIFAPVPCAAGRFTIDKLPTQYTSVWVSPVIGYGTVSPVTIPASNEAMVDLVL